jgi:kumamolisin
VNSRRPLKSKLFLALAGAAALALPLAMSGTAGASAPNPNTPTPVQGGVSASSLPNATVFGTTPSDTPETVSFIMKVNNASQLQYNATHSLSKFVTVSQFAKTYGASTSAISSLTAYLAKFGIISKVYADNVDISTTGTAGEYDAALAVTQQQYHVPRIQGRNGERSIPAQTVHANKQLPELPYGIAQSVLAVLGLTNYSPFTSHTAHVTSNIATPQTGSTDACLALTGLSTACHLPSDFTADYGLNSLHAKGAGTTLAIVTLAALDPGAPAYFWQNIAHVPASNRTLTVTNVDGGPGAPSDVSGSGETDLDVEQSGSIASAANVIVYQAPNTDAGFADSFFDAASQNTADSVSASWGESETYLRSAVASGQETAAYEAAFDEAFMEFAVQGQSGFLSSGDSGAYDASGDLGTTDLSVDSSADSPYITSSGGTTLPLSDTLTSSDGTISAPISVTAQRAWGWDYLWQAVATTNGIPLATAAEAEVAGDGGGYSVLEATPAYQQGVSGVHTFSAVQYLKPTAYQNVDGIVAPTDWIFNATPTVTHGTGDGRAEPDVSANADPISGYLLYEPSFATASPAQPVLQGGWGGTSFVAPQLNGSAAVIDSYVGHRVGFWNPAMYAAATGHNSPLTPLNQSGTSNDNLYYTGTPGTVYNPATGLGYPNLSALAGHLASGH